MAKEKIKFWRAQCLNNLELMQATYFDQVFARHAHDSFAIGVVEAGTGAFTYRGATQVAPAGSIFVINPGVVHTGGGFQGWCTYRVLYPEPALLARVASEVAGKRRNVPFFLTAIIDNERLRRPLLDLHCALESPSAQLEQESRLLWVLTQMIARYTDESLLVGRVGREHKAVKQVQEYLAAHYAEQVSLDQLVELTGLSAFHLTRVFCQASGLPPHAWQTQVRVWRAKELLAQGHAIAQVALSTGFAHQSHLNKHFKRLVGMTPGQYQRSSKIVQDSR
jgi:AraC-like DNA-binding protein